ncbi:uncharacterized protein FA14DRAFT_24379 [Meira miltonrushii]|uniref:Nitrogen regulatory protein areA GATA-like domain-containing protein n=1 Tax=Meira miltonrushii TaxID=1280837 RepID=A0A316VKT2_9BASI|nr:uncharacterized protein FA14DRAFT_24379 [Meira miltonrushii]PWN38239.1 hypothetical protein FA14DRAFT_24379 [Meira miltonrushii]
MMSAPAPYPTVQSSAPAIDDHEITTRTPSICVDYLSHNWTDEDVWSSWKAMTKRKNEIANGVRLENASWRTWAKQRGKLKTISPETLNWLKDSDVTWLYGPLHEHAEPVPPPRQATARERLGLEDVTRTKSILKHRTISEMLTTPGLNATSPSVETPPPVGSGSTSRDGSDDGRDSTGRDSGNATPTNATGGRPAITFTKSETALSALGKRSAGSPPASERLMRNMTIGDKNDGIVHSAPEEKRHISFNQRVDQCIAVDAHEEEEEEDEDDYSDGNYEIGRKDDDEGSSSDEEVLTMKSSPRSTAAWPTMASSRNSSPGLEHQTIAKLAPTILKTSDTYPAPSPQVVDPSGFTAHFNGSDVAGSDGQPRLSAQPQLYQYDNSDEDLTQTRYSQWDADDDFNGDFDYFNGPDVHDSYHSQSGRAAGEEEKGAGLYNDASANSNAQSNDSVDNSGSNRTSEPPRSILKRRPAPAEVNDQEEQLSGSQHFSPPSSPETGQSSLATSPSKERGRTSQRVGSSASYERIQDAARGTVLGTANSTRARSSSSNGSIYEGSNADQPSTSSSPPSTGSGNNKNVSDRRESFRGRAGDGSKAMEGNRSGSAFAGKRDGSAGGAFEGDSDGRASLDFNSPGYPASPLLGDKDYDSDGSDEAKLYGNKKDSSRWADARSGKQQSNRRGGSSKLANSVPKGAGGMSDDEEEQEELDDEGEPSTRLSVDLENLPSNTVSPPGSAPGGPTPLNTPTFALAKSRSGGKKSAKGSASSASTSAGGMTANKHAKDTSIGSGASSNEDWENREPESPTLPRRSSATGALVAPSDADKVAGVRVPLAHDYVEEDEGGIVGRAVEIVNTARDLIGALLGTGGDRGRSWREAN